MKKIALIGSTGMIGQRILHEALSRGHKVMAIARDISKTGEISPNLDYRSADIFNADSLMAAVAGQDVVVSAYGPGKGDPRQIVKLAHTLIEALGRLETLPLIVIGGAGSLEAKPGVQLVDTPDFPAAWKASALAHRDALEVYRKAGMAGFEWTSISPAAFIEPGTRTGKYRTDTEQLVVDAKGQSRISAEDFAVAIVDEIENPKFAGRRFTVGY